MVAFDRNPQDFKYLRLLSRQFPTEQSAFTEIINLSAILNLPKGTEHFMSDVHGEYEAFMHILNNCSGVVREHVDEIFGDTLTFDEKGELCTLIYYPREKIDLVRSRREDSPTWYKTMLDQLIVVTRSLSSRYTRSKVRKAIPRDYAYIIDELLHTHPDENNYRVRYHERIVESILETASADDFIESLASLIKRLAVDHLHLVGDIFDRGGGAAKIMDRLLTYHSLDIQWGNHDLLWMGAAAGEPACIATVLRNNLRYDNYEILENDYGISLRELVDDVLLLGREHVGVRRVDGGEVVGRERPHAAVGERDCAGVVVDLVEQQAVGHVELGVALDNLALELKEQDINGFDQRADGLAGGIGGVGEGDKLAQRDAVVVLEDLVVVIA